MGMIYKKFGGGTTSGSVANAAAISALDARLTTAEGELDTVETNLGAAYSSLATVSGSISSIQTNLGNAYTSLALISGDLDTAETTVGNVYSSLALISGDLDTAESSLTTVQTNLSSAYNSLALISGDLDSAESSLTLVQSSVTNFESGFKQVSTATGLQYAIDEAFSPIYIVPGEMAVTGTITIPQSDGYRLEGTGISRRYLHETSSGAIGPAARLVWTGEAGGTIMEYKGHGLIMNGLSFVGARYFGSTPSGQAGVGFKVWKESTVLGTGKGYIGSITALYCDVGVQFGEDGYEDNADNTVIDYLNCEFCNTGLRMTHADAVEISVGFYRSYFPNPCAIRCDQSSLVAIFDGSFTQPQVVWSIGQGTSNSGNYMMYNVRFDNAFGDSASRLVEMDKTGAQATIVFNGCQFPGNPEGEYDAINGLCDLDDDPFYGPSRVIFVNCKNVPRYLRPSGSTDGVIEMHNCSLGRTSGGTNFTIQQTRADYWTNCTTWNGTRIADNPYMPTSDPLIEGEIWNDGGFVKVSSGV